jgi:cytochrome c-type biogenesis protein CcmH
MWGPPPSAVRAAQPGRLADSTYEVMREGVGKILREGVMANSNRKTKRSQPSLKAMQTLALCAFVFAFLGASDPVTRFNEIGHQMMCVCGCNQILLECNHVGCPDSDGMRNELMASLTRGDSDSLVEQGFVQKYGPTVLAAPTTKGFDRAAYIMPFAALILGFGLIVLVIRAWKNRPAPAIADGLRPVRGAELEQFRDQARQETDL